MSDLVLRQADNQPRTWFEDGFGKPEGYHERGGRLVFVVVRPDGTEAHFQCAHKPPCPGARIVGLAGKLGRRDCPNICLQIKGPNVMHAYFAWGCRNCIEEERDTLRSVRRRCEDDL